MVKEKDTVNHPEHYESGSYECIDEMIAVFGMSVVANFCLCNVWKYRYRALNKTVKRIWKNLIGICVNTWSLKKR